MKTWHVTVYNINNDEDVSSYHNVNMVHIENLLLHYSRLGGYYLSFREIL